MKLFLLLLALASTVFAQIQPLKSTVIEVTDDTFDALIGDGEWLFYMYIPLYLSIAIVDDSGAKWCSYCRHLKADFDLLSSKLLAETPVRLGRADIDDSPGILIFMESINMLGIASKFMVAYLPSIYQ